MKNVVISVHTPKVAGTTFARQLATAFGEENILFDYSDDPANLLSRRNIDPAYYQLNPIRSLAPHRGVHGHFHPEKYDEIEDATRITFLRHPIENIVSIYQFWRANSDKDWDSPVFRYFKEEGLDVERLALLPVFRHLYTRTYFGGFDMGKFDFIGNFSFYREELARLESVLDVKFAPDLKLNVTPEKDAGPGADQLGRLSDILADDIAFFEKYAGR